MSHAGEAAIGLEAQCPGLAAGTGGDGDGLTHAADVSGRQCGVRGACTERLALH